MTRDEIEVGIVDLLEKALGVEREEIVPTASLQHDLGAESIDMIDITFRIERTFNIEVDRDELFPDSVFDHNDGSMIDGRLTLVGLQKLKTALSFVDWINVPTPSYVDDIPRLFTVSTLINFVAAKINQKQSSATIV